MTLARLQWDQVVGRAASPSCCDGTSADPSNFRRYILSMLPCIFAAHYRCILSEFFFFMQKQQLLKLCCCFDFCFPTVHYGDTRAFPLQHDFGAIVLAVSVDGSWAE